MVMNDLLCTKGGTDCIDYDTPVSPSCEVDALTTYGVKLFKPSNNCWVEISILGKCYKIRSSHTEAGEIILNPNVTNELEDGSIIDISGVYLLFQTPKAMVNQEPV
jgi:hypothetical protein